MEELSIKEKAERYDKAVINGSRLWECGEITRENYEYIFPEFKEDENERIKKEIIRIVNIWTNSAPTVNGIPAETLIAWLEKQGQKPVIEMKTPEESLGVDSETYNKIVDECIYGEQKPTNKVEQQFNEGDWVVFKNKHQSIYQVEKIEDGYYILRHTYGGTFRVCVLHDEDLRLWTIQDAKPGDVLACENDIVIFKENNYNPKDKSGCMFVYCSCNNFYEIGGINPTDYKPATKEQCDLLFTKMKETGYEWDSNKKELKKIEQKSVNIDYINGIRKELMSIEDDAVNIDGLTESQWVAIRAAHTLLGKYITKNQKPAWSEEDENHLDRILKELESQRKRPFKKPYLDKIESDYNWLKLLKERYAFKPSDEQMKALEHFVRSIGESGYTSQYDNNTKLLYSLLYNLKKLKGE